MTTRWRKSILSNAVKWDIFYKYFGPPLKPRALVVFTGDAEWRRKYNSKFWIHRISWISLLNMHWHIYFRDDPEPCCVDDDLNSLKLRAFTTETYFNMVSAIITSASILPLPSPASFPIYNVKFAATTLKPPCCAQGKGTSPFKQEAAVPVPMQP